nr:protein NRT1/ PTR FAMILY 2.7-like [Tanacetum cinerariifolium]
MFAITLASGGLVGNLIVYLITKYNVKSIDATQINNVVLGCSFLIPIAGAILVDSFYGSFVVIVVFLIVSLMGMTLMTLTASLPSLRPSSCTNLSLPCESPSKLQYGILYMILGLTCIGFGGTRFTIATMGGDQFMDSNSIAIYFNCRITSNSHTTYRSWDVLTVIGLVSSALVEAQRIHVAREQHLVGLSMVTTTIVTFSALWLMGFTSLIRKSTAWLMDDLNDGRLDTVYWLLAAIGVVNFGYFSFVFYCTMLES